MIERVQKDPFSPVYWGKNQKGMQAGGELEGDDYVLALTRWRRFGEEAIETVRYLVDTLNLHKQIANRLLEPWLWHTAIVTATEWSNFFNLRANPKAQPEIRVIAEMMQALYVKSSPLMVSEGQWHLPLILGGEDFPSRDSPVGDLAPISAARCARVSYLTHDGQRDVQEDLRLHGDLLANGHMSPLEHPCRSMTKEELRLFERPALEWDAARSIWRDTGRVTHFLGNVQGWVQLRKLVPGEEDILGRRAQAAERAP